MLDINVCKAIGVLVEKLSTTGKDILDMKTLKELFLHAATSEEYLRFLHERLIQQLEKPHSEIRYGTFLIIDHLFMRSEYFRGLLLEDFEDFLELVVESDPLKPLPKPFPAAKKLKQKALQAVQKWFTKFGKDDKRLHVGYNFIKNYLKVDFEDAEKRNASEIARAKQKEERLAKIVESRIAALRVEVDENVEEISRVVMEMDNCCGLLIPSPENFLHAEDGGNLNMKAEADFDPREHGLGCGPRSTININVQLPEGNTKIQKTEDNEAIIQNLKDLYSLCKNRFLPRTKKWVRMVSRGEDQDLFKRVMDLKQTIESEMKRFEELKLVSIDAEDSDSESTDSDFEDVPDKDDYEEVVKEPPAVPAQASIPSTSTSPPKPDQYSNRGETWDLAGFIKEGDEKDPTTENASIAKLMKMHFGSSINTSLSSLKKSSAPPKTDQAEDTAGRTSNSDKTKTDSTISTMFETSSSQSPESKTLSRKEKLLQSAPKLPFDIDLYHWEDHNLKAPSIELGEGSSHRFWKPSDREGTVVEAQDGIAALRTRRIEFTGKFEPIKWSCRAPLKSGKLCPRKDRVKCPFHGKVIPRDESGNPTEPEDIVALAEQKAREDAEKPPEWQDPEFLKDLKAQIGIDLTIKPAKKARKRKTFAETYPGLTDVDKEKKTPRARLHRKIFNRNSVRRVAAEMDSLTHKRHRDKFGDQFNYAMNDD